ncbi:unnamed protein product [Rhizophagus irregularis]|nr:unnamed protein product [Rhizophagus irregularis]
MFEPPFLSFDIFEVGMYIFKVRDYLIVDHSQNHVQFDKITKFNVDRGCNNAEVLMRPGIGGEVLPLYLILGYVGDAVALCGQALAFFMRPGIGGEALPLYLWIRRRRCDFMRPGIGGEVTSQWISKLSLGGHASVGVCNIFFSLKVLEKRMKCADPRPFNYRRIKNPSNI